MAARKPLVVAASGGLAEIPATDFVSIAAGGTGSNNAGGALAALGAAPYGLVTITTTGGTTTLNAAQYTGSVLLVNGALTSNAIVIVPATGNWIVLNRTTGAFSLTLLVSGGAGISVGQGFSLDLVADGVNVVISGTDAFSSGFLSIVAPQTLTDTTSGTASLTIDGTGNAANGANLRLLGPGATTPGKSFRVQAGILEFVNSAYTATIAQLTDAGVFSCIAGINNTTLGATTPAAAAVTTLSATGAVTGAGFTNLVGANTKDYVVAGFQSGLGAASLRVVAHYLPHAITLPALLASSAAVSFVAATASSAYVLSYVRAGVTTAIATFTFAAAGKVATISGVVIPTLANGDMLVIVGPASPDATLADIAFSVLGAKQ